MGLPRPLLFVAATLFASSVLALLISVGVFFWHGPYFWNFFDVDGVLLVMSLILGGMALSSGLLFIHSRWQASYLTFESIVFLLCFGFLVANLGWMLPALLIG